MPAWRRKNNRLPSEVYVGDNAYLLTVANGRASWFIDATVVAMCQEKLVVAAEMEGMDVLVHVFMPDHLHMLAVGSADSQLSVFMKRFKQATGFSFQQATGHVLWQKGYHDHVLRREEDLEEVAGYVALNPVRAGLVEEWTAYPYTGGRIVNEMLSGDLKVAATSSYIPGGHDV